jgi:DNA polymerase-1
MKFKLWDLNTVHELLKELEFRRLHERMQNFVHTSCTIDMFDSHTEKEVNYTLIDSLEQFNAFIKKLKKQEYFVFDLETDSLNILEAEIAGIAFSWKKDEGYYIPLHHPDVSLDETKVYEVLKPIFADPLIYKIAQNIKFDAGIIEQHGIAVDGIYFDTMIAAYLLNPGEQVKLDKLSEKYLNYEMIHIEEIIGKKGKKQKVMTDLSAEFVYEYACEDADITYRLYKILKEELKDRGMAELFYGLEMPVMYVLMRMEQHGVKVDEALLKQLSDQLANKIAELQKSIFEKAGEEFNLNSPQQLGVILFDKLQIHKELGVRKPSRTKTGQYSTSEKTLERYVAHPVVASIMEYRKLVKLKNTYIDALPKLIHPKTGKIHTSYNQTVTATGRLSSSNPNLQNIPIRTDLGKEIRRAFIPSKENYLILSADYSQIELRIMAHLSGDETMIENFKKNKDIHAATAALIFNIPVEEVTPDHRRKAKEINFGIIYGMTPYGLASRLGISKEEAQEFIADYFATYPKVGEFMQKMIAFARKHHYVETMMHRRRYLPEILNSNQNIREFAERTAINTPIQGSAADLIKKAMIDVQRYIEDHKIPASMLLQVHDELVFEVDKTVAQSFALKIKDLMEHAAELRVPLVVDWGLGNNWLEAH